MPTKLENIADPSSCWSKAADDEPVFILRAQDRTAPAVIRDWVGRVVAMGLSADSLKVDEALDVAVAMERWREANGGGKVPD